MSAQISMSLEPLQEPSLTSGHDARGLGALLAGSGSPQSLPLRRCTVRSDIVGPLARTTVQQVYENTLTHSMEAVHLFPLPERGAVVSVVLRAGEVTVHSECKPKAEAEQVYATARAAGHRTALLTQERPDIHTLRVANLPPQSSVTIEIVIEESLEVVDGRAIWRFPTTIAPRYTPGAATGHEGPGTHPDTDIVPDASRLSPPLRLDGGAVLDIEVTLHGPVHRVASSLHAVAVTMEQSGIRVAPSGRATLDRDFVLAIEGGIGSASAARAWTDGAHTLLLVDPPPVIASSPLPRDAVFLIDISGSMDGQKLKAACLALKTALHGLLPQDRFRVIAFDDRVEVFHPAFLPVEDTHIRAADRWIDQLRARGGTEMAPAFQTAFEHPMVPGRQRTILFITDGQSTDEARLLQLVWRRREGARIFPLGIDTAVNAALLNRLARIGGGVCELTDPSADIEAVVARLEARFGTPLVEDLRIEPGIPVRSPLPALFAGRPLTVLLEGTAPSIRVSGTTADGPWTQTISTKPAPFPLGPTWARERVAALEDRLVVHPFEEEAIQPEIVRVALAHSVATRWTSHVLVDTSVKVYDRPVEVVQPAELPHQWAPVAPAMPPTPVCAPSAQMAMTGAPPPPAGAPQKRKAAPSEASFGARLKNLLMSKPRRQEDNEKLREFADEDEFCAGDPAPAVEEAAPMECEEPAVEMARSAPAARSLNTPFAPPPPAPAPAPSAPKPSRSRAPAGPPSEADLARSQRTDGSFDGDVFQTVAVLARLLSAGHTRQRGLRKRVVQKAAGFLAAHRGQPAVDMVLALLDRAEAGETLATDALAPLRQLLGKVATEVGV